MKTFEIEGTQELTGFYRFNIKIEAKSKEEALEMLNSMSNEELEELAYDWEPDLDCMEATGDLELNEDTITEI